MPVVQVDWISGRDENQKKTLIKGIADAFEKIGVDKHKVHIIIRNIPKTDWGENGESIKELKKK